MSCPLWRFAMSRMASALIAQLVAIIIKLYRLFDLPHEGAKPELWGGKVHFVELVEDGIGTVIFDHRDYR